MESKNLKKIPKFRPEAVLALETPENLDTLIHIISKKSWIILIAFYLLLICLVIWGFFGTIPSRVEGRGVLLVENGTVYNTVAPPGGGRIMNIDVKTGQKINKGQVVAILRSTRSYRKN